MGDLKITKTAKVQVSTGLTVGDLRGVLAQIPSTAKISVYHYEADHRDPRETSYTELTFTWED